MRSKLSSNFRCIGSSFSTDEQWLYVREQVSVLVIFDGMDVCACKSALMFSL